MEIQRYDTIIKNYLDSKFVQLILNLKNTRLT